MAVHTFAVVGYHTEKESDYEHTTITTEVKGIRILAVDSETEDRALALANIYAKTLFNCPFTIHSVPVVAFSESTLLDLLVEKTTDPPAPAKAAKLRNPMLDK